MYFEIFVVAVIILLIYLFKKNRGKIKGKVLPGLKGLPFFGCVFEFNQSTMPSQLSEYARKFGDIFQFKMLSGNVVVLNSVEMTKKAFCSEEYKRRMNDRGPVFFMDYFRSNGQTVSFANDKMHSFLKKYLHKGLHTYGDGIQHLERRVMTEMQNLVSKIDNASGQEICMVSLIQRSLSNVISLVLSGEPINDDDPDVDMFWEKVKLEVYLTGLYQNFVLVNFPIFRFLPGHYGRLIRRLKELDEKIGERYWYQQKDTYVPGEVRGLADYYIEAQQKNNSTNRDFVFHDHHIISQFNEVIDAGMATSSSTILNSFAILLNYPECQKKIQTELDRVIGRGRFPSSADRDKCVYLRAFELEVHRYIPVLPLIPHMCNEDIEFEGFHIPANARVIVNVWHIHHDEKIWGDPWNFRPERFLDESGNLLPQDSEFRQRLLHFGIGPRICPGQVFARTRYFLYMASLLQRWTFEFPPNKSIPCDPRIIENFTTTLTMRIKSLNCIVKERI